VQIDQNRLRVTARLLDAGNGRALWSGRFNENLDDFFVVQESLAAQVVRALALELSPEQRGRLARRDTADPEAWQLFLNGRYQFGLRTVEGLGRALEFYEAAVRRDPSFALPHAGIADVLTIQGVFGLRPPQSVFPRAYLEAQRAVEIDRGLAEAHLSLGHIEVQLHRNWREAERLYRHSLSLRSDQARGRLLLANCLMMQGRTEEALAEGRWSQSIEPADVTYAANLGMLLTFSRRYDLAYEQLNGLFRTAPNLPLLRHHLARLHILRGEPREAIALLEGSDARVPGSFSNLGRAYALAGRAAEARAELARLRVLGEEGFGVGFDAALIHAALGERDAALTALESGLDDLSQMLLYLNVEPGLDPLRDEPRFRALVERLGLS
jgi:serine/threonine-protein kinase